MTSFVARCPVEGCPNKRSVDHLVCADHWREVPTTLQRQLFVEFSWRKGLDQTPNYFWVRERILAHLEGRLPDPDMITRLLDATA